MVQQGPPLITPGACNLTFSDQDAFIPLDLEFNNRKIFTLFFDLKTSTMQVLRQKHGL